MHLPAISFMSIAGGGSSGLGCGLLRMAETIACRIAVVVSSILATRYRSAAGPTSGRRLATHDQSLRIPARSRRLRVGAARGGDDVQLGLCRWARSPAGAVRQGQAEAVEQHDADRLVAPR